MGVPGPGIISNNEPVQSRTTSHRGKKGSWWAPISGKNCLKGTKGNHQLSIWWRMGRNFERSDESGYLEVKLSKGAVLKARQLIGKTNNAG